MCISNKPVPVLLLTKKYFIKIMYKSYSYKNMLYYIIKKCFKYYQFLCGY